MTGYLSDQGDAGATPVVFLHGAGADHTVWRFQTRWLAGRGWRTIAPDLPGHGRSHGKPPASIEAGAEWLTDLLDGLSAPVVVGHSMGALISLEAAAGFDRIARLVLVGAALTMPVHPGLIEAARNELPVAASLIAGWSLPAAHRGGHPQPGTWHSGGIETLVGLSRDGVLAADLEACAVYDGTRAATLVTAPTTVISGEQDRMVRAPSGAELASAIRGADHIVMAGAGHEPMVQQPSEFNRLLAAILTCDGKQTDR